MLSCARAIVTFHIGLHEMCVRTGVLYVITKFSEEDSLPNFLTHGAPLRARFARARSSAISCAGSQAFEDVHDVVNRLGDSFMGMTWARKQKERLKSGKRYLKGDFNVNFKITLVCVYKKNRNNTTSQLTS